MSKHAAISLHKVSLAYANQMIVADISMEIGQGEFIGILGPNGSGKSTFLRALLGLLKPIHGQLQVLNQTPKQGHLKIGYMPQMRHMQTTTQLSSRALLYACIQGTQYGLPILKNKHQQQIKEALALVNAEEYADKPFHVLSGGEKQRIFLAQALLNEPKLLLLDEPLANLDPRYQEMFIQLLYHIKNTLNVTILITAHDPNPLLKVMDRVLYFARGKFAIGTIDNIITSHSLSTLYGIPIEVIKINDRLLVIGDSQFLNQDFHHV